MPRSDEKRTSSRPATRGAWSARLVGDDESFSLSHRLANGLMLLVAGITFLSTVLNLSLGYLAAGVVTATTSASHAGLYAWSRHRESHTTPTLLSLGTLVLVFYPGLWLTNFGLEGGMELVAVTVAVAAVSVLDGWPRRLVLALTTVVTGALFSIEYAYPDLLGHYGSRGARFVDVFLATALVGTSLAVLFRTMQASYERERERGHAYAAIIERTNRELEAALAANRELALTDPLTQLPNRRSLEASLSAKVREVERYHRPLSLILLDVDHFKAVNDTHGHAVGDAILVALADVMGAMLRSSDMCARWGGEEFVLVCPETDLEGARVVAERLRDEVERRELVAGVRITISLGVAVFRSGDDVGRLFERADAALYEAKRSGRNRAVAAEDLSQS
jgi:diguanylate cyclase (GGDEF)-like protein